MLDDAFTWAIAASVGSHVVGIAAAAALGLGMPAPPAPSAPVPIDVITAPAPEPPPAPRAERVKPPKALRAPAVARPAPAPIQPSTLIDDKAALDLPGPAVAEHRFLAPNAATARPDAIVPGPREGSRAGAGELFSTGDIPVRPGSGTAAGSGAGGRSGIGLASLGNADPVAAAGVTSFARPLGGYQTIPRYPESARRAGIEGVAVLRFVVEADGRVGKVLVERSAGHAELDQSATEAVKTWRFEPARRGKDPVSVWVTLPVRFSLTSP